MKTCPLGSWDPETNTIHMCQSSPTWRTQLAHALLHQNLHERYGDQDLDHVREEWRTKLPAAVAMLARQYPGL
jgi:hypothetical protein